MEPVSKSYETTYDQDQLGLSSDVEMSMRHRQLVNKIRGKPHIAMDPVAIILAVYMMLYTPDFIDLDDAKEAERQQTMYACLLNRYKIPLSYYGM